MRRNPLVAWLLILALAAGSTMQSAPPASASGPSTGDTCSDSNGKGPRGTPDIDPQSAGHPTISKPSSGSVFTDAAISVSGRANGSDDVKITVGSNSYEATINSDNDTYQADSVQLAEDKNTVEADGFLGSWHTGDRITVYYLQQPGPLQVTSPASVSAADYTLGGTYGAHTTRIVIDDGTTQRKADLHGDGTFSLQVHLHDGTQTYTLTPYHDSQDGNASTSGDAVTFSVTLKKSGPARPAITSPSDGQVVATIPPVSGTDATAGATIHLFDNDQEIGTASVSDQNTWSIGSPNLADDQNVLKARAQTSDGTSDFSGSITIYYLAAPDKPTIGSSKGTDTTESTTVISGTIGAHTDRVRVVANGTTVTATLSGNQYSATVSLAMGNNSITAYADHVSRKDASKYTTTASDTITLTRSAATDAKPPEITSPQHDSVLTSSPISVSGLLHDAISVQIKVMPADGGDEKDYDAKVDLDAGTFSVDQVGLTEDRNRIEPWGKVTKAKQDPAGANPQETKRGTVIFVYYLQKPGPLQVTSSASASAADYTLSGTYGAHTTRIVIDDGTTQRKADLHGDGTFSLQVHLRDGTQTYTLTPYHDSKDGNASTSGNAVTFSVTLKTSGPARPAITSPPDGQVVATIPSVSGTDATSGATIHLFDNDQEIGTATVSDQNTWTIGSPNLADDQNILKARAQTNDGTSDFSGSITVYYLAAPGKPTIGSSQGTDTTESTTVISGTIGAHTDRVRVVANGTGVTATLSGNQYSATVSLAMGNNSITAYADHVSRKDATKYTTTASDGMTVTRSTATDAKPPEITAPKPDSVLTSSPITVSGLLHDAISVQIKVMPADGGDEKDYDAKVDLDAGTFSADQVGLTEDRNRVEAWGKVTKAKGQPAGTTPQETKRGSVIFVYYLQKPGHLSVTSAATSDSDDYTLTGKAGEHTSRVVIDVGSTHVTVVPKADGSFQTQLHLTANSTNLVLTPYHDSRDGQKSVTGDAVSFTVTRVSGPATPSITGITDGQVFATIPAVGGTDKTVGATVRLYRDGEQSDIGSATVSSDQTWSISASRLREDQNVLRARAEKDGKQSGWSSSVTVYYLPAPDKPDAHISTDGGDTASVSGQVGKHTTRVRVKVNQDWVTASLKGQNYTATIHLGTGTNTITVYAENVSRKDDSRFTATPSDTLTVERSAIPAPAIETPMADAVLTAVKATISGTEKVTGAYVDLFANDKLVGTTVVDRDGRWSTTITLPEDRVVLTAKARTDAGSSGPSKEVTVYVLPLVDPKVKLPTASVTDGEIVAVVAAVDPHTKRAWVVTRDGSGGVVRWPARLDGTIASVSVELQPGTTEFWVLAENVSQASPDKTSEKQSQHGRVLRTVAALAAPQVAPPADPVLRSNCLTLSGTASWAARRVDLYAGGRLAASTSRIWSVPQLDGTFKRQFEFHLSNTLQDGGNTLTLTEVDNAGHAGAASASLRLFFLPIFTEMGFNVEFNGQPAQGVHAALYSHVQKKVVQVQAVDSSGQVVFNYREPQNILDNQGTTQVTAEYTVLYYRAARDRIGMATYSVQYQARPKPSKTGQGAGSQWELTPSGSTIGGTVQMLERPDDARQSNEVANEADDDDTCHADEDGVAFQDIMSGMNLYYCTKNLPRQNAEIEVARLAGAPGAQTSLGYYFKVETELSGELTASFKEKGLLSIAVSGTRSLTRSEEGGPNLSDDGQWDHGQVWGWYGLVRAEVWGDVTQVRTNAWTIQSTFRPVVFKRWTPTSVKRVYSWPRFPFEPPPALVYWLCNSKDLPDYAPKCQPFSDHGVQPLVTGVKHQLKLDAARKVNGTLKLGPDEEASFSLILRQVAGTDVTFEAKAPPQAAGSPQGHCFLEYRLLHADGSEDEWPHLIGWTEDRVDAIGQPKQCDPKAVWDFPAT